MKRREEFRLKGWLALLAPLLIAWLSISCKSRKVTTSELRDTTHLISEKAVRTSTRVDTTKVDNSTVVVTEITLTGDTATISNGKIAGKITKVVRKEITTHSQHNGISVDSTSDISKVDSTHYIYEKREEKEKKSNIPIWLIISGLLVIGGIIVYVSGR